MWIYARTATDKEVMREILFGRSRDKKKGKSIMRFPNAYKGVFNLILAEILQLIGSAVGIVVERVMLYIIPTGHEGLIEIVRTAGIALLITGFAALFIAMLNVVAGAAAIGVFAMNLIGLVQAKKDCDSFKYALVFTLFTLPLSIAASYLYMVKPSLATWMTFGVTFIEMVVFEYVVTGIRLLAEKLGNKKMHTCGGKMRIMITILYLAILSIQLFGGLNAAFTGITKTIGFVIEIVLYITFLIYLIKARNMLEKA